MQRQPLQSTGTSEPLGYVMPAETQESPFVLHGTFEHSGVSSTQVHVLQPSPFGCGLTPFT
jgi:hypothetical protein